MQAQSFAALANPKAFAARQAASAPQTGAHVARVIRAAWTGRTIAANLTGAQAAFTLREKIRKH